MSYNSGLQQHNLQHFNIFLKAAFQKYKALLPNYFEGKEVSRNWEFQVDRIMKINWNMEHGRRTNWGLQISEFFLPETPSFLLFSRRLGVSGGEINGYISLAGDWRMEELRSPCLKFIRVDSSPLLKMFVVRRLYVSQSVRNTCSK